MTAAKGGGVSFAGKLFEYAVRFAYGVLIANFIGVEQYGLYNLGITVALIATNMAMFGLQTGMVRYLPGAIRDKDERAIWQIIQVAVGVPAALSILLAAGLAIFADPLAMLLFNDPRMAMIIRIASLLVPMDTLESMAYVITISYKQPKYSVIANNIISPLAKLGLTTLFLLKGQSTVGVLVAQVVASAVALVIMIYYTNRLFSLRRKLQGATVYLGRLMRYSIPVQLGWMVNVVRSSLSTLVLGFLGLATGVGEYTAASRFSMIGTMFTPILADYHSHGQKAQMKAYYQTTTRWMVIFNLPLFLTSVIFAKPLLSIFGDDFTAGATSMMILAIGTLAYTSTGLGSNILDMTDHPKVNTINSVVMVFVTILLNVLLIPPFGVIGAAIASSASTLVVNIIALIEVWALLGIQPYNASIFKPLLAGLISGLAAFLLDKMLHVHFLVQLAIGGVVLWGVYALTLYLLKIPPDDMTVIRGVLARLRPRRAVAQNVT
jgi:O-antigen/teichoic acid export membrane protein